MRISEIVVISSFVSNVVKIINVGRMENLGKNSLYLLPHRQGISLGLTPLTAEDGGIAVGDQEVEAQDHTGDRFLDHQDPIQAPAGSLAEEQHQGRSVALILEKENV